ncbi:MAG: alanine--tRNA ligase-related protein, partial [Acidilobaceae archaeon]
MQAKPSEYEVPFFKETGFSRRLGEKCREYYWTLNPDFIEPQDVPCVDYWFDSVKSGRGLSVSEARRVFVEFFMKRGHEYVPPKPVVARWREDLYLTIASIVVFQPHVTNGIVPPPANPLVISQPSIRLEDIDNVGLTIGRHLTSFEMAAHHAFNYPDKYIYWKDETVRYAYEFFTKDLGIPGELLVFKESWWEGGGNAGPCFEVAVGGLELATLVFMSYKTLNGGYEEIPLKIVDTGYGVERITWFSQKTPTAFHAIYGDLVEKFRDAIGLEKPDDTLLWAAFKAAGRLDPDEPRSVEEYYRRVSEVSGVDLEDARRILVDEARLYGLLDHTKTLALMLADGIVPSNSGEGYLARLVARRALRLLALLKSDVRLADLVDMQVKYWGGDFPQVSE